MLQTKIKKLSIIKSLKKYKQNRTIILKINETNKDATVGVFVKYKTPFLKERTEVRIYSVL